MAGPKPLIRATARAKGKRMRLPGWVRLPAWIRLPGRTVRVRLTALYGILFVMSGALLLAIASGVAVVRSSVSVAVPGPATAVPGTALGRAQARIHQLQTQVQGLQSQLGDQPGQGRLSRDLLIASLFALAVMTVVSVALGWLVAGRALRPVREMTAAAQRISEDNLDERLAVQGPKDELKELGDTIDGLLERLEIAFKAQRRFVANASHELRTPLTTMRAALDVALAKPDPAPPQTMALAARLRTELDRIDRMLENVIDNAVCHNTDGGWIRITSGTADGRASVVVENGGPVLEQDQVRELSQPFRRIGADRTGSDSGSGLGLSIVAAIAEAHGGSLDLQARPEGGLRVSIQLPAVAGVPAGARA